MSQKESKRHPGRATPHYTNIHEMLLFHERNFIVFQRLKQSLKKKPDFADYWKSGSAMSSSSARKNLDEELSQIESPDSAPTFLSMPLESISTGVALPYRLYIFIARKYTLFRNFGDSLTQLRMDQLLAAKVDTVFILNEDWEKFIFSLEEGLNEVGIREGDENSALSVRKVLFSYWKTIETRRRVEKTIYQKLRSISAQMPVALGMSRDLAYKLLRRYDDPSLYFANHSINTAVYSLAIGMKSRLSNEDLTDLSLTACMANLGIIKIPKAILYKPGPLTDDEWQVMRKHPIYGEQTLKLLFESRRVSMAVRHHHERMDGSGYPDKLRGENIPLFSRIVAIGESFSAMTGTRPWATAIAPLKAVELMQAMEGKFDPAILRMSIKKD
jgi:HD-GYP domain-containing protein (c-di-GMP phosphodiesterase class II)